MFEEEHIGMKREKKLSCHVMGVPSITYVDV